MQSSSGHLVYFMFRVLGWRDTFGPGEGVAQMVCQSLLVLGPLENFREDTQMVSPLESCSLVMNKGRGIKRSKI